MPNFSGMWTVTQQMQARGQGIWTPVLPAIGAAYEGGFFAGQIGVSGVATHNLVVGPVASAQNASKQWKIVNTSTAGTTSVIDGPRWIRTRIADRDLADRPIGCDLLLHRLHKSRHT